jgi:hypothetical protein
MLPNAVVMMVGAPSPILKETPTGELLEEGHHLLLHGSLDVNHVVQSALGAVSGNGFLMVQLCGSRRDLGREFVG